MVVMMVNDIEAWVERRPRMRVFYFFFLIPLLVYEIIDFIFIAYEVWKTLKA